MTKDELVISYWAIGPSYRRELKENLAKQPLEHDWFNIIILTDYPDDFAEFSDNKNILAILDIAKQRELHNWSFELEPIGAATTDEAVYSTEFNKLREQNKKFSYSLHRFSLPWIAENGFSKAILLDADVYFRDLDHAVVDTNRWMQGFITVNFDNMEPDGKIKLLPGREISISNELQRYNDTFAELLENEFVDIPIQKNLGDDFFIGDGPVRVFKFEQADELMQYFNVWNFVVKNLMSEEHRHFIPENYMWGPYVINDEVTFSLICKFLNIHPIYSAVHGLNLGHNVFKTRYFALLHGPYKQASSLEEFLQINNITLDQINL